MAVKWITEGELEDMDHDQFKELSEDWKMVQHDPMSGRILFRRRKSVTIGKYKVPNPQDFLEVTRSQWDNDPYLQRHYTIVEVDYTRQVALIQGSGGQHMGMQNMGQLLGQQMQGAMGIQGLAGSLLGGPTIPDYYSQTLRELPTRKTSRPLVGVRQWALTPNCKLASTFVSHIWEGPILRADHPPKDHVRVGDQRDTGHGIYTWRVGASCPDPITLQTDSIGWVEGTVHLLGRVVEHERGYRAERVRIASLCITSLNPYFNREEAIESLEDRYQCEVLFNTTLHDIHRRIVMGIEEED